MNDNSITLSGQVFNMILNYIGAKPYTEVKHIVSAIEKDLAMRAQAAEEMNQPSAIDNPQ